jgi:hypothetical protein
MSARRSPGHALPHPRPDLPGEDHRRVDVGRQSYEPTKATGVPAPRRPGGSWRSSTPLGTRCTLARAGPAERGGVQLRAAEHRVQLLRRSAVSSRAIAAAWRRRTALSGQGETSASRSATCASTLCASMTARACGASARASGSSCAAWRWSKCTRSNRVLREDAPERGPGGSARRSACRPTGRPSRTPRTSARAPRSPTGSRAVMTRPRSSARNPAASPPGRSGASTVTSNASSSARSSWRPRSVPPEVCGKGDPWDNEENFHRERLALPPRCGETCAPPVAAPRGAGCAGGGVASAPPHRSVR